MVWQWPSIWDWVNFVLAMVGVLMAVQPFLQMIYGKPKLTVSFESIGTPPCRMICHILNPPLMRGCAYRMGVRTMAAEDIIACFQVADAITKRIIVPSTFVEIFTGNAPSGRVRIPVSGLPSMFRIANIHPDDGTVRIEQSGMQLPPLQEGRYLVIVQLECEGQLQYWGHDLAVQNSPPYALWEGTTRRLNPGTPLA